MDIQNDSSDPVSRNGDYQSYDVFDSDGNWVQIGDNRGYISRFTYDERGNQVTATLEGPGGTLLTWLEKTYDEDDNLIKMVDVLHDFVTIYHYENGQLQEDLTETIYKGVALKPGENVYDSENRPVLVCYNRDTEDCTTTEYRYDGDESFLG
jgi:hypothetical protein